jgi:predicted ATP pyrophosphatase (TIGR00289 family)
MFHVPNIHITELQAEAMGLPLLKKTTKGEKERELEDLREVLLKAKEVFEMEGVVTGAIRSIYQAARIQRICKELNLWCFNPLWLSDEIALLNEIVSLGFNVIISGIFTFPLDEWFLGKKIDEEVITKLSEYKEKFLLNPAG